MYHATKFCSFAVEVLRLDRWAHETEWSAVLDGVLPCPGDLSQSYLAFVMFMIGNYHFRSDVTSRDFAKWRTSTWILPLRFFWSSVVEHPNLWSGVHELNTSFVIYLVGWFWRRFPNLVAKSGDSPPASLRLLSQRLPGEISGSKQLRTS